jgi:hypothetical protein
MAKQRGGSPFTDSWFEMPFWFLFFLLIVTVILLWQFGIFNKPAPPPVAPKQILPGQTHKPPSFVISDASGWYLPAQKSNHIDSYHIDSFFTTTNFSPSDYTIMVRSVSNIDTNPEFTPVQTTSSTTSGWTHNYISPNLDPTSIYLEAYISYQGVAITPTQRRYVTPVTQPGARNSSGSSDPLPSASSGPGKKAYTSPSLVGTL